MLLLRMLSELLQQMKLGILFKLLMLLGMQIMLFMLLVLLLLLLLGISFLSSKA